MASLKCVSGGGLKIVGKIIPCISSTSLVCSADGEEVGAGPHGPGSALEAGDGLVIQGSQLDTWALESWDW